MKTYNTICGIICIILLIAALICAAHKQEAAELQTEQDLPAQEKVQLTTPEPEPTIAPKEVRTPEEPPQEPTATPQEQPTETISTTETTTGYQLTEYERSIVERVVMAESGNQSIQGQMAVAQCIFNTARAKGMRPDAIVLAPGQYATPATSVTDSVKEAVSLVFDEGRIVIDEPIRYFYAPKYSSGSWHESALQYVCTIGDHKFFKIPN